MLKFPLKTFILRLKAITNVVSPDLKLHNRVLPLQSALLYCFKSQNFFSFFQELQRRLDQTLGKPGNYHHGIDKEGHIKPMTIGGRLYRLENQVCILLHCIGFIHEIW